MICKKVNGGLIYFVNKEEFLTIRNWTIRNVTDRYPFEMFIFYHTAGNRPYVNEERTPCPNDDFTLPLGNLKWNIAGTQEGGWKGISSNYSAWRDDRNIDLGSIRKAKKRSYGWQSITESITKEVEDKAKNPAYIGVPRPDLYSISKWLWLSIR